MKILSVLVLCMAVFFVKKAIWHIVTSEKSIVIPGESILSYLGQIKTKPINIVWFKTPDLIRFNESWIQSEEFTKENFIAIANACKAEAGATDDELKLLFNHAPATTKSGKCLKACSMKKFDVLTADSKLNVEGTTAIKNVMANGNAEQEKLGAEVIDICAKLKLPADNCEAAEALDQCLKKNSDAKGFIVTNFA